MRRVRIIPVLLIQNGGLVKSKKFKSHKYVGDPINAVKIFNDKEVDEIIVLDISATKQKKKPNFERILEICGEAFMPLAYGGGISTLEEIKEILYNGAEKVILNTACFDHPELIQQAASQFGNQSIVASIDFKKNIFGKYRVFRNCGNTMTKWEPIKFAQYLENLGVGEIFFNSIARDGTYSGFDLEFIEKIAKSVSIPVVASGGASELSDFTKAIQKGASAAAAGSMFVFQRPHQAVLISYPKQENLIKQVYENL